MHPTIHRSDFDAGTAIGPPTDGRIVPDGWRIDQALIQEMQVDLRSGTFAPAVFAEDLDHVQKSLQVCRRIFGGMLTFSRNAARRNRDGHVRRAIETASAILRYGMSRSAIELGKA